MTDKELPDRVVALGVGAWDAFSPDTLIWPPGASSPVHYKQFVNDWHVAGALLEKANTAWYGVSTYQDGSGPFHVTVERSKYTDWSSKADESLPRAIIEACCDALEGE